MVFRNRHVGDIYIERERTVLGLPEQGVSKLHHSRRGQSEPGSARQRHQRDVTTLYTTLSINF